MHIDFKVTNWERIEVPDELQEKILAGLKAGTIQSLEDIANLVEEDDLVDYEQSVSYDSLNCIEQMTPEENGGCATIEAYSSKNEQLFNNEW